MKTTRDSYVWLERRRFHWLNGQPKYRITIETEPGVTLSADGDTVETTWTGLAVYAEIFGTEIATPCPFDEKGRAL